MPKKAASPNKKIIMVVTVCVVVVAAIAGLLVLRSKQSAAPVAPALTDRDLKSLPPQAVMDYNKLGKDAELDSLMGERKAKYGVENGIDMVVKPDESLKIGDKTVPVQEIIESTKLKRGDLIEKDLKDRKGEPDNKTEEYGIYVVQPGDNIWNIHFNVLKDYFKRKSITLSPMADEPEKGGFSSGVGKILKFSERMVYIYNIKDGRVEIKLDLIHPLSKIVVYRMGEVFSLLDEIDYQNVNHIQFDGETIWIPASQ